jgi:hypothetical protein
MTSIEKRKERFEKALRRVFDGEKITAKKIYIFMWETRTTFAQGISLSPDEVREIIEKVLEEEVGKIDWDEIKKT